MKTLTQISADEFLLIAPKLGPCELVKGEIVPMVPGGFDHSNTSGNIFSLIRGWARKTKLGVVVTNEAGLVLEENPDTVRGGDVVYISYGRLSGDRRWKGFLKQIPELVVEVLSEDSTWNDIEKKIAEYHDFGVDMVWVADPHTLAVKLYPRKGKPRVLQTSDEITGGKLLPGFRCKVASFFDE